MAATCLQIGFTTLSQSAQAQLTEPTGVCVCVPTPRSGRANWFMGVQKMWANEKSPRSAFGSLGHSMVLWSPFGCGDRYLGQKQLRRRKDSFDLYFKVTDHC